MKPVRAGRLHGPMTGYYATLTPKLEDVSPRERRLVVLLFDQRMKVLKDFLRQYAQGRYQALEPDARTVENNWNSARREAHHTMRTEGRSKRTSVARSR